MATVYKAVNYAVPEPTFPGVGVCIRREFLFTNTVALILADSIKLCRIPAGVVVTDYYIALAALDSGGSEALKLDLGDNDDQDEFVAATTKGQAAAVVGLADGVTGSMPRSYTAANDFILKVQTAATAATTDGVIRGWLEYHFVGSTSPVVAV